jgi:5'-nucleotidase
MRRAALALPLALACAAALALAPAAAAPVRVRLLALNDLHGQIDPPVRARGHPAGGAAALAAWLRADREGFDGRSLLVHAGDLVGASPPASGLLQDEPAVALLNGLAGPGCRPLDPGRRDGAAVAGDPACDVVGAVGNHELDEGAAELLRLLRGGAHAAGPYLDDPWRGATWPTVCANLVDRATGRPLFPASVVRELGGVRVGIVGALSRGAAANVSDAGLAGLEVRDEVEAVNGAVASLRAAGVRTIVVLLHEGGHEEAYAGPTRRAAPPVRGELPRLVARLDGEVDVVVSGHTHAFTNAFLANSAGRPVLVTGTHGLGGEYARIDLRLDPTTGDVTEAWAEIVTARADAGPGLSPDAGAARLVAAARARVAPRVSRVVATAAAPLRRPPRREDAGESALGDLVADAFRAAAGADVALVNPGGLRADVAEGPVTWGDLYAVLPFGNDVVRLRLRGRALRDVLERQSPGALLQVSGVAYAFDPSRPRGERTAAIRVAGAPLDPDAAYAVAVPSFLADAGRLYGVDAVREATGPRDLDALEAHLRGLRQPFAPPAEGRISVGPRR